MTSTVQTPLNWNVPIVGEGGRPTNEFMQKWTAMLAINKDIPTSITTATQVSELLDLIGGTQNDVLMRGVALWAAVTGSDVLDIIGSAQGDLLVRGASAWQALVDPADTTKFLNGAHPPVWGNVHDSDLSFSNITTNDVSITKHGFAPKAPNDATKYLDGTGAYSVPAGGGGGGGDFTKLAEVITSGTAATVTFSGIAATYRNLKLMFTAKCTNTTLDDIQMRLRFNGDNGANYSYVRTFLNGSVAGTVNGFQTELELLQITTAKVSNNALDYDSGEFTIFNYADTARWRKITSLSTNTNGVNSDRSMVGAGRWQNNASAISSIVVSLPSDNFVNGSVFSLYGIK